MEFNFRHIVSVFMYVGFNVSPNAFTYVHKVVVTNTIFTMHIHFMKYFSVVYQVEKFFLNFFINLFHELAYMCVKV